MRHVLAVIVLCGCGGSQRLAIENRGGAASTSCELPARLEFEARRYGNVDADDPDYQVWSSWRVGMQFGANDVATDRAIDKARARGTLAMTGDDLTWTFDIAGTIDHSTCRIDMAADTHEPINLEVDLRKRTGTIRSIDDIWLLGPPFPAQR
jgi:hypothetical protein